MKKYFYFLTFTLVTSLHTFAATNNDTFELGPFDLTWGYTLQEAQFLYPNGLTYPVESKEFPIQYALPKSLPLFWAGIPVEQVHFNFDSDGRLSLAFLLFKYSELDAVRVKSILIFGQKYKSKEINGRTTMYWNSFKNMNVQLNISKKAPYEWVVLALGSDGSVKKK